MKLARVLGSLSLAVLAVAGPYALSQANVVENQTAILYVDAQSGSDSNSGSLSSPLKTIQAAVNKANVNNQKSIGTKIVVNAGVYRETVKIDPVTGLTSAPLTLEAAQNGTAIISASDVLAGWSSDAQYAGAYVANWTPAQSTCPLPSGWPAVQPIGLHTEMVFVNSVPMTQVLAYADLKPGTFYVNSTDGTLHVWPPAGVDLSSATTEVANRVKTIGVVGRSNVVLRGLVLEHAADCINTSGATITGSTNVLIDKVEANWNNWGGLGISSSTKVTVQNSIASYNGGVGFQGTKGQTTLYSNNETDYNNWRGAQATFYNWASGGAKFFQMRTTSVQGHTSYNNQAQGLWFDTDNQNITINNATLVGSHDAALQLERNEGPITLQNSHLCTSGVGVNVLTTQGLTVTNNVFYNNGATNKYQAQFYLAGSAGGINIANYLTGQVYNLITTGTVLSGNSFIDELPGQFVFGTYLSGTDWTDFTGSLKSNNNVWYDPNTASAFRITNGKNVNLSGWQTATGADYNSAWSAPASSPASACAVPSATYADFNLSLDNGSYTMSSGRATATVRVNSFNFGAVNLSVSGLPKDVTASFSNPNLTSGSSILTLTASSTSAAQTVAVTLWGVSGDRVHSATFNLGVNANPAVIGTITTLSTSASTINENSPVTLTATVKQTSGTTVPAGSVTFYNGGNSLGSVSLASGTATLSTSSLPAGSNSITALYSGNSTFNASSSSAVTVTVNSASVATSTSLVASATAITQNSPVTLTATVTPASGTTKPTGTITFYNGSASLGSASLLSGVATLSTSALPAGTDSITAVYSGAASFNGSTSNSVNVTVNAAVVSTSTKLVASSSTITQNSLVTLTATVTQGSGTATPTGTVTFYNGSASLGSATLAGGTASMSTSALPAGTDSISAAYSGAVAFNASSSNIVAITVNQPAATSVSTVTTIAPSATSVTQGSPLTLVATVKQASGTTTPSGVVTFLSGGTTIGTAQLSAGVATFTTSALPAGTNSISASYSGTSSFKPSASGAVAITVSSAVAGTTTTLTSSASSVDQNLPVTFKATVKQSSGTATPTGTVTFYSGTAAIGTATLSGGLATFTTSSLPVGTHSVTASYAGNTSFKASTSSALGITVNTVQGGTTTSLAASPTNITQNSPVTFTATVKQSSGTVTPDGTVTFYDGSTALGSVALSGGAAALTTSSLSTGQHSISANYAGSGSFHSSSSNIVNINVDATIEASATRATTSTVVSSSAPQADQGFTICLTASVAPTSGSSLPTGTVNFSLGGKKVGSATLAGGKAFFTTSALPAGDDVIIASYAGNGNFAASNSPAIHVKIVGPDFTVQATPSTVSTKPGQSVDVALLITPMNGFNQVPSLTCSGLPSGSKCSFASAVKQPDGTSIVNMTIQTASQTADSRRQVSTGGASYALAFLPLLFWISSKRRREFLRLLGLPLILMAIVFVGGVIGCGGKANLSGSGTTPSGSSTVSITVNAATTTGITHTATVKLTLI